MYKAAKRSRPISPRVRFMHTPRLDQAKLKQRGALTRDSVCVASCVTADLEKSHRSALNKSNSTFSFCLTEVACRRKNKTGFLLCPAWKIREHLMVRKAYCKQCQSLLSDGSHVFSYTGCDVRINNHQTPPPCGGATWLPPSKWTCSL